jgi:hypothetical protein
MQAQSNDASIYYCMERDVSIAAMIKLGAQSGMHVSNHGIVEIYAAFRDLRGDLASGFPVAGSVPDT